jgi:hypothetical protein
MHARSWPKPARGDKTVVFDVELHEKNKLKFLEALYNFAQEQIGGHANSGDPALIGELEAEIGKRTGLTRQQAERINAELEREGKTEYMGAVGSDGPIICLTREGLSYIEHYLDERSKRAAGRQDDLAHPPKRQWEDRIRTHPTSTSPHFTPSSSRDG